MLLFIGDQTEVRWEIFEIAVKSLHDRPNTCTPWQYTKARMLSKAMQLSETLRSRPVNLWRGCWLKTRFYGCHRSGWMVFNLTPKWQSLPEKRISNATDMDSFSVAESETHKTRSKRQALHKNGLLMSSKNLINTMHLSWGIKPLGQV